MLTNLVYQLVAFGKGWVYTKIALASTFLNYFSDNLWLVGAHRLCIVCPTLASYWKAHKCSTCQVFNTWYYGIWYEMFIILSFLFNINWTFSLFIYCNLLIYIKVMQFTTVSQLVCAESVLKSSACWLLKFVQIFVLYMGLVLKYGKHN